MPSGGARAISGPPPDPNALRRDKDKADWVTLPQHRRGRVPKFPLPGVTGREKTLWREMWTMPQAVMWERDRQEYEVAIFVRTFADAETKTADTKTRTLLRQQMEALGLSRPGLLRYRWRIEGDTKAEKPAPRQTQGLTMRERLAVIEGG